MLLALRLAEPALRFLALALQPAVLALRFPGLALTSLLSLFGSRKLYRLPIPPLCLFTVGLLAEGIGFHVYVSRYALSIIPWSTLIRTF